MRQVSPTFISGGYAINSRYCFACKYIFADVPASIPAVMILFRPCKAMLQYSGSTWHWRGTGFIQTYGIGFGRNLGDRFRANENYLCCNVVSGLK